MQWFFDLVADLISTPDALATLVAGFAAVLAAIGVAVVVERREQGRLKRQHAAARAVLPLALSATSRYAADCVHTLQPLLSLPSSPRLRSVDFSPPRIEPSIIDPLRVAIEHVEPRVGEAMSNLLSKMQILAARLDGLGLQLNDGKTIIIKHNIFDYIINAVEIHARASDLFSYARGETNAAPVSYPSYKSMMSSFFVVDFDLTSDEELSKMVESRAKRWARESARCPFIWDLTSKGRNESA